MCFYFFLYWFLEDLNHQLKFPTLKSHLFSPYTTLETKLSESLTLSVPTFLVILSLLHLLTFQPFHVPRYFIFSLPCFFQNVFFLSFSFFFSFFLHSPPPPVMCQIIKPDLYSSANIILSGAWELRLISSLYSLFINSTYIIYFLIELFLNIFFFFCSSLKVYFYINFTLLRIPQI